MHDFDCLPAFEIDVSLACEPSSTFSRGWQVELPSGEHAARVFVVLWQIAPHFEPRASLAYLLTYPTLPYFFYVC